MHLLVKTLLEEARRRGAVLDAIEHHDLIAQLDLVAQGFATLPVDEALDIADPAIALSDTCIVRALCPASADWYTRGPKIWWGNDEQKLNAAICWAHCNGRGKQVIASVSGNPRQAWQVISEWVDSLTIPLDVVAVAIAAIARARPVAIEILVAGIAALRKTDTDAADASPSGIGHLYATLMREYSRPLEYFLFDLSDAQLDLMIESLARRNLEDGCGPVGPDGKIESAAARRRRANWTAAKMEFLRRVLPTETAVTPGSGDANRTTDATDRQSESTRPAPSNGTQNRTEPSATGTQSAPQATATVVDASSQLKSTAS